MIDFHCHSVASDGSYTPLQLLDMAEELGISHLAVTDHDTTDGLDEFFSRDTNVVRIPGIEISVDFKGGELHIVGLFIDRFNKTFKDMENMLKGYRLERNEKMVQVLSNYVRKPISICDLLDNPKGQLGKPHVAKYLVRNGYALSINDAFDKYLQKGMPLSIPKKQINIKDALEVIKEAGGISIMAHPSTLKRSNEELESLIKEYKALGLDGVEAYSSHTILENKKVYEDIAMRNGMIISCGSDFHGANGRVPRLGAEILDHDDSYILDPLYKRLEDNRKGI